MNRHLRTLIPAATLIGLLIIPDGTALARQSTDVMSEMNELGFLLGEWEGRAWIQQGPEKHHMIQRESVQPMLGGEVLFIQGRGVTVEDTTKVGHEAVALIGFDSAAGQYVMRTFLSGGRTASPVLTVDDGTVMWQMGESVRYTVSLNDSGQWFEIGEFSRDGGKTWAQFFEMTLDRVAEAK